VCGPTLKILECAIIVVNSLLANREGHSNLSELPFGAPFQPTPKNLGM